MAKLNKNQVLLSKIWSDMTARCRNGYHKYNNEIQEAWSFSKDNFYNWAIKNGWDENKKVNRIDKKKPFSEFNCEIINK